jgi:hypothetical protein
MEAKRFLVSRIAEEARRGHHPLSETEEKMLYWSENYPTLPDMAEVGQKFEREYDSEKFEGKIARISRRAYQRDRRESPENARHWREAIKLLKKEDHYILVMIDLPRSAGEIVRLILVGLIASALLVGSIIVVNTVRSSAPLNLLRAAYLVLLAIILYLGLSDKVGKAVADWLGDRVERLFGLR